jgi:hypothetical protein
MIIFTIILDPELNVVLFGSGSLRKQIMSDPGGSGTGSRTLLHLSVCHSLHCSSRAILLSVILSVTPPLQPLILLSFHPSITRSILACFTSFYGFPPSLPPSIPPHPLNPSLLSPSINSSSPTGLSCSTPLLSALLLL